MNLYLHPSDSANSEFQVQAELRRSTGSWGLEVNYAVVGPVSELDWASEQPIRHERLWEKSCFELFAGIPGAEGYWEWNFVPGGAWAFFEFFGPRRRAAALPGVAPGIHAQSNSRELRLKVVIRDTLPPMLEWALATKAPLEFSLNAILATKDGRKRHFALKHVAEKADFHRREAFSGRV